MSLYIGNLSAQTRKDELERVFRKFGECDLRLKDGYGFVVYGFAPQAEKAMKLLQGRAICGQQLTITWSNKQPRPVRRAHRPFEPRRRDLPPRFRPGIKLPENGSDDVVVIDDGDGEEGDEEPGGRWGERAENEDSSNDGGGEAMMTDRYDPYRGYDRRDKDGDRWIEENSGEREQDVAHGLMFRINCFGCGELGHKMRDCPAKRGKFKRFENNSPYRFERYPRHRNDRATPKYENTPEIEGDEDEHVEKRSEKKKKKKKRESKFSKRLVSESADASVLRSDSKPLKRCPRSRSRSRSKSVTRPRSSSSSASRSVLKSRYSSLSPPPLDPSGAEVPEPSDRTTIDGVAVSVEEMCVALRHFGAEMPGGRDKEKHGSLEAWFGSARLWPWEGIYYRRVKKGPISVKNYERRVAQNREFGIVDRFVRSSSGWGEISQKNP